MLELYQRNSEFSAETNPDYQLYQGFTSEADKTAMQRLHQIAPEALGNSGLMFQDDRLNQLLFRFRARNYPHTLTHDELQKWQRYCHDKLTLGVDNPALTLEEFTLALENAVQDIAQSDPGKMKVLQSLFNYVSAG